MQTEKSSLPILLSVRFPIGKVDASSLQAPFSKQLEGRFTSPIAGQALSLPVKLLQPGPRLCERTREGIEAIEADDDLRRV